MRLTITKSFITVILKAFSVFIISPILAQSDKEATEGSFQDDLLNHLVGKWKVSSIAHEFLSNAIIEAEWILNHQN